MKGLLAIACGLLVQMQACVFVPDSDKSDRSGNTVGTIIRDGASVAFSGYDNVPDLKDFGVRGRLQATIEKPNQGRRELDLQVEWLGKRP